MVQVGSKTYIRFDTAHYKYLETVFNIMMKYPSKQENSISIFTRVLEDGEETSRSIELFLRGWFYIPEFNYTLQFGHNFDGEWYHLLFDTV